MQTTERPPSGPTRGGSPVRGVVLVAVAVVLGFFVLRAIDDTAAGPVETTESAEESSDTTVAADDEAPDETDTTEAEAPPARDPGEVTVLVANASGVQGAAAGQTDAIQGGGYLVAQPTNAPDLVETTQVLAVEGYEAEAAVLAADIGAPEGAVNPMPDPPPLDLAGAQLLVLLGPDLAGG
ncbi:MAG TPA: LytR C-terminal domain-containing protein [Acidimicrobiales bacterium]